MERETVQNIALFGELVPLPRKSASRPARLPVPDISRVDPGVVVKPPDSRAHMEILGCC